MATIPKALKTTTDPWVADVEAAASDFARRHRIVYTFRQRELSAVFEIGCFLMVLSDYERQRIKASIVNPGPNGEFRYLTTPSGNPANFSHIKLEHVGRAYELRQQVRMMSGYHPDIAFTPDIVVIGEGSKIERISDVDYAAGKRGFFRVAVEEVISFHECKSMTGFPELYVSFVGMLSASNKWHVGDPTIRGTAGHLAPSLFVGGASSNLHLRMIGALEASFPLNILTGVHRGGWVLSRRPKGAQRFPLPAVLARQPKPKRPIVVRPTPRGARRKPEDIPF